MYSVRYTMYGVRYTMYGIRYTVHNLRYDAVWYGKACIKRFYHIVIADHLKSYSMLTSVRAILTSVRAMLTSVGAMERV